MDNDAHFMKEAIKEAGRAAREDEVPIGAVAVYKNRVIGRAHNQTRLLKDPTAHAEMIALTQAAGFLKSERLTDVDLYVTIEPCIMCTGAMVWARIRRVIFGAWDEKAGGCGSVVNVAQHAALNHRLEIVSGVLEDDCRGLMRAFFRKKRLEKQSTNN
ncbi:MAG: tRNA adenosine(34) deaminase TadA [Candidatus Omnitrophica bacterium]|nr:tRNA adenosine(34) deaminase TadA [Candidatus Omnitrophota bacterium]